MPAVPFVTLPDSARVWVFASPQPILGSDAETLLAATDEFVRSWAAHGALVVGSVDWCYDHFLLVAADEAATGVSGCSIDALFHTLKDLERSLGLTLLDNSPVWFRAEGAQVRAVPRAEFREMVTRGEITDQTIVFDNTVGTVEEVRSGGWERPFAGSWHVRAFGGARKVER
jgi:hypothetical protein